MLENKTKELLLAGLRFRYRVSIQDYLIEDK